MSYTEFAPPDHLRSAVVSFWMVGGSVVPAPPRRVFPDGCFDLVFDLAGPGAEPSVVGPMTRAIVVPTPTRADVFGIRFRPGPASRLFGPPLAELRNAALSAHQLLGRGVVELHEKLTAAADQAERVHLAAAFLSGALARSGGDPALPGRMALTIDGARRGLGVTALADRVGLSPRQLERSFLRDVGLRPKELLRLARFRAALDRIRAGGFGSLGRLAYDLGYSDQAHFTREFRGFAGLAPSLVIRRPSEAAGGESDLFKL